MGRIEYQRLLIRNLNPETNEVDILDLLSSYSTVKSIKLTHKKNQMSCCEITLFSDTEVRMIIDSLNGSTFKDYMLAVTCLLTPEELEEAKTRTVIIRGLDEEIPFIRVENEIKYMSYSATVFPNFSYNGSFSGSYSVVCKDEETALAFVNNLNNQEFLGRTVNCYLYSSSFKRTIQLNLHIRNFPMTWTTEDLKKYCGRFGDVNSCIRVQKTENYAHGFVSYFNKESVERALKATEKENPTGLEFELYRPAGERIKEAARERKEKRERQELARKEHRVMFLRKLPQSYDETWLRNKFKDYGTIEDISVMPDNNHKNRYIGYITFDAEEAATQAVRILGEKAFVRKGVYGSLLQPQRSSSTSTSSEKKSISIPKTGLEELLGETMQWDDVKDFWM